MKTPDQIQEYIDALVRQGIGAYTAAPPLYRWFWRKRINITPPFNQSFLNDFVFSALWLFATMAISFTLLVMLVNWVLGFEGWAFVKTVLTQPTFYPVIFGTGLLFGLTMAGYVKYRSKNLKIPKW